MPNPLKPNATRSPSPSQTLASTMGFTTFANPTPRQKKRKRAHPPSGSRSGPNTTPLGVRTAGGLQQAREEEEKEEERGGPMGRGQERTGSRGGGSGSAGLEPDPLAAAALDETAAVLLETGLLPHWLDWEGVADEPGQGGGVEGEMGRREDGGWDWQALRKGVVVDERGDVAFYDASFVEDPWRGLRGEGR